MDQDKKIFRRPRKNAYSAEEIVRWEKSGLTRAEYGVRNGIHPNVLSRWIRKYEEERSNGTFVRVETPTPGSNFQYGIQLHLSDGMRISIGPDMDPVFIARLVNALRGV